MQVKFLMVVMVKSKRKDKDKIEIFNLMIFFGKKFSKKYNSQKFRNFRNFVLIYYETNKNDYK